MGSGYFIRNEALADSITGFRLETLPLSEAELAYWGKRPEFLGDAFSSDSWAGLDRYMLDHGIPKYDLIACRPWGAWKRFSGGAYSGEIENLTLLLSRAANRLSSTGEAWFSIYSTHTNEVFAQASRMIELKDTLRKMGFRSEIEQSAPAFIGYKVIRVEMRISPVRRYSL